MKENLKRRTSDPTKEIRPLEGTPYTSKEIKPI